MPETEYKLPKLRRGPKRLALADLRTHTVSVRLNSSELADLDTARAPVQMQRGEYLRAASRGVLPPTIPQINREAWASLAGVAGNLNQYQKKINEGLASGHPPEVIQSLMEQVQNLRRELLGIAESGVNDEGED